jgi:diacylglycerol kinase family enzyme
MRALLVVNPAATTTTARGRRVIESALGHDLKLEVGETGHRGHAAELARQAVADGLDLVISLGGDGTVNEIVNGLLAGGPRPGLPDIGVVPGGSTNVFARAAGLPRDPVEATGLLLDAVRQGRRRSLGLGRADSRWFTFCAGVGLDAEVVHQVEQQRSEGRRSTSRLYLTTAVRHFFRGTDRKIPAVTLTRPGRDDISGLFLVVVANTAPWTYLGERPVTPTPDAAFDTGLDVFALRGLHTLATLRHVRQILSSSDRPPKGHSVVNLHDQSAFSIRSTRPVAFQLDGDYLGERDRMEFQSVAEAIRLVA